jgi:ubiquinone/menaquinone biosynthesis C-methylase UbiE
VTTRSDPYAQIAAVYDQADHIEITRAFLARAESEIAARPKGTWVLDLACGTGVMAELLGKRGVPVLGIDRSASMLAIARRRCGKRRGRFVEGDLTSFSVSEPCSVATSCGDVMNHLPSPALLRRVFKRIYSQLQPGGVLMFETTRRYCYEQYWTGQTYHLEGPAGDLTMECDWDPKRRIATANMICYAKNEDGSYSKSETPLVEYLHATPTLRKALRDAGFRKVAADLWSPWPDQHLEPEMDRYFWTARRP